MGKGKINLNGLSWKSALLLATAGDPKRGNKTSPIPFVVISDERAESDKFRREALKEERTKAKDSVARGNHYRAKFKRVQTRKNSLYDGKEVNFTYTFEFATTKGKFKVEESEKSYDSKAMAIQNCRAKLAKWWEKKTRCKLPKSFVIKGRKIEENNYGVPCWQLWVKDNSTARQFSDGPLLPHKLPKQDEVKDTYKEGEHLVRSR